MVAYCNYKMSPTYRLDQTYSQKTIDELQLFMNSYPNSERVKECNKLIDEMRSKQELKAYNEAELYYDTRQYQSAVRVFENMLKDFPETQSAEKIRYMVVRSHYLLAENSVLDKQEERYRSSITSAEEYLEKYKNSGKYSREIQNIYKDATKKLKIISDERHQNTSARTRS